VATHDCPAVREKVDPDEAGGVTHVSDSAKLAKPVKSVCPVSELDPDDADHVKVKLSKVDPELLVTVTACVLGAEPSV
jgi:hypothetical protein